MIGENFSSGKLVLFLFKISRIGLILCVIGIFSNMTVILGNNGKMPVIANYHIDTEKHITATNNSSLLFLADWIEISVHYKSTGFYVLASLGDVIIWFSLIFMIPPAIISILLLIFVRKRNTKPH